MIAQPQKLVDRAYAVNLEQEPWFQTEFLLNLSSMHDSPLSGLCPNFSECSRAEILSLKFHNDNLPKRITHPIPELKSSIHNDEPFNYRKFTHRRRAKAKKRRMRKWEEQDVEGIEKKIDFVLKVGTTRAYYAIFRHNKGHTHPWKELIFSITWTTILMGLHQKYYDLGQEWFGIPVNPTFSHSFFSYISIALGFLLYIQAEASSRRWWEGRIHWQRMMEDSKRLTVLVNTHLSCLRMSMLATQMMCAHTICVRNILQDKLDVYWWAEMLDVLEPNIVDMIMRHRRELRYLAVLYAFQRIIKVSIDSYIMPSEVIRDINPAIISMGRSFGACNRIRLTKLPWIVAVHLHFILLCFCLILPISLVELQHVSQLDFLDYIPVPQVYLYVLIISYAFFGLCRMAIDIDDPFSFSREHHSFGFWGFYCYWSRREIKSIESVLDLRTSKHGEKGITATGNYGDDWAADKLEDHIRNIVEDELPTSHNLWGRRLQVLKSLQSEHKRSTKFWEDFNKRLLENESPFVDFVSGDTSDHGVIDSNTIRTPSKCMFDLCLLESRSLVGSDLQGPFHELHSSELF